ncbi:cytochrome P450 [Apiospora phragmitis]|uniref:Cytochrome P450 n=1 Tax=Apiospora phragmitis TaxID=2905665 RepID=A0ABR1T6V7_9PEZI
MDLERDWFAASLLAPDTLWKLQAKYHGCLRETLAWGNLSATYVLTASEETRSKAAATKTVSLARFCQYTVSYCSTVTFFGRGLLELAPDFLHHYQEFETESWKIFYRLPPFIARRSHRGKNKGIEALVKYLELPDRERVDMEGIFKTITSELGYLGVDQHDIAAFVMVFVWA